MEGDPRREAVDGVERGGEQERECERYQAPEPGRLHRPRVNSAGKGPLAPLRDSRGGLFV